MADLAPNIASLRAEQEQRRQYDTSALRAALADHPSRSLPSLSAENEQRRAYDTSALRAALADHPSRPIPLLTAENEQRRQYDTTALQDVLADTSPALETNAANVRAPNRTTRTSRRPTSYFNAFQTSCSASNDAPPNYANAQKSRGPTPLTGGDDLPEYSCSVVAEAKLFCCVESQSPLSDAAAGDWKEVYAIIRGTMLSVYRLKDGSAGKLVYTYTLQHAEVGLAPDVEYTVLVPQTRFAHFIPSGARRRAWQKDQTLFKPVQQTALRLRVETEQILLAGPDEDSLHEFMFAMGSGIDIAQPIDDRSIPRQCTVPRRRRRPRPQSDSDLTSPAILAEQERILATMYPGLAAERQSELPEINTDPLATPTREDDEIDVSFLREEDSAVRSTGDVEAETETETEADNRARPPVVRLTPSYTINPTHPNVMVYATSPSNFDLEGKWAPSHVRSPAQIQRYLRRCLPQLLADSPRASDVMICQGRRIKVNWRMELLEDWELQPPSYKSHEFPTTSNLVRTQSQNSRAESLSPQNSGSLFSNEQHDDEITPIESGSETVQLAKALSANDKGSTRVFGSEPASNRESKGQDPRELVHSVSTAVYF